MHLAFGNHIEVEEYRLEDYRKSSGHFDGSKKQIFRVICCVDYLKLLISSISSELGHLQ